MEKTTRSPATTWLGNLAWDLSAAAPLTTTEKGELLKREPPSSTSTE
jgi:hypothetical protein